MKRYSVTTPWARPAQQAAELANLGELETSTPARPADLVADLLVPIGQAVVTGGLLAGLVVFVVARTDYSGDLVTLGGGLFLAVCLVAWLLLLVDTRRLLWAIERLTGRDLDGDLTVGDPKERVVIVNAAKGQREAAQQANTQRASQFAQFVAALPIKGTSQRAWEPELGRATYQDYRDALIRLGWARWKSTKKDGTPNETKGWKLALDAAEILERISG